jgi:dTDP-glucose 4,6-dehydratase
MTGRAFVTGCAGFLGSHFVRTLTLEGRAVLGYDALTYAGDMARLRDTLSGPDFEFVRGDVVVREAVRAAMGRAAPDTVVHFAAESHVTRGERDADRFDRTNILGTRVVLEESARAGVTRFVHVSTDEVYGPILSGAFGEDDKQPGPGLATSAYARSKAIADDLARAFAGTMEVVVVRPTNCFGPWQHPEKALPRWITSALLGAAMPVWGDGRQVRQWLYAKDLAGAIELIVDAPDPEPVYNVGPRHEPEIPNVDLARWVAAFLGLPMETVVLTAYDRPDHDRRYAVDPTRIEALGWKPGDVRLNFERTVDWYRRHRAWWVPLRGEAESIYRDRTA